MFETFHINHSILLISVVLKLLW